MKWLIELFHEKENSRTSLLYILYHFPPPKPLKHDSKNRIKIKNTAHTNSRCSFLSWHTFPFMCSIAARGNSTALIELLFQQACGRDSLGCLQNLCPALKILPHSWGWASRQALSSPTNRQWEMTGREGIRVVLETWLSVAARRTTSRILK